MSRGQKQIWPRRASSANCPSEKALMQLFSPNGNDRGYAQVRARAPPQSMASAWASPTPAQCFPGCKSTCPIALSRESEQQVTAAGDMVQLRCRCPPAPVGRDGSSWRLELKAGT